MMKRREKINASPFSSMKRREKINASPFSSSTNKYLSLLLLTMTCEAFAEVEGSYNLVMSNSFELCDALNGEIFNKQPQAGSKVWSITWEKIKPDKEPLVPYCSIKEKMIVDLNGDGLNETIFRNTGCLSGLPAHEVVVLGVDQLDEKFRFVRNGDFYELIELDPPASIGGLFVIDIYNIQFEGKRKPLLRIRERNKDTYPNFGTYDIFAEFSESYDLTDVCYFKRNYPQGDKND